jgi:hypothetical protein
MSMLIIPPQDHNGEKLINIVVDQIKACGIMLKSLDLYTCLATAPRSSRTEHGNGEDDTTSRRSIAISKILLFIAS